MVFDFVASKLPFLTDYTNLTGSSYSSESTYGALAATLVVGTTAFYYYFFGGGGTSLNSSESESCFFIGAPWFVLTSLLTAYVGFVNLDIFFNLF